MRQVFDYYFDFLIYAEKKKHVFGFFSPPPPSPQTVERLEHILHVLILFTAAASAYLIIKIRPDFSSQLRPCFYGYLVILSYSQLFSATHVLDVWGKKGSLSF